MNGDNHTKEVDEMDDILQIFLAEYNALRREIELLIEHQKDIMNFSILTIVAMVGLAGVLIEANEMHEFSYIYLAFPLIFLSLALLYADKTVRILRAADYIHNYLRKRIIDKYGEEKLLKWEHYKSHESSYSKGFARILDKARWIIFILPSAISIGLFIHYYGTVNLCYILLYTILIAVIYVLFIRLDETGPIKDRKLPGDTGSELLLNLSEKDKAAGAAANIIVKYYSNFPGDVQDLLLGLSKRDETAGAVARVVAENFNNLPQNVRDKLLLKLSEKDETVGAVADILAKNFDELENVRDKLLLRLVDKEKS